MEWLCPACDWYGRRHCLLCDGRGVIELTGCPHRVVTADVRLAIRAAERAEKGFLPLAGGWLNQTQKCLEALEMIEREEAEWTRKHKGE